MIWKNILSLVIQDIDDIPIKKAKAIKEIIINQGIHDSRLICCTCQIGVQLLAKFSLRIREW